MNFVYEPWEIWQYPDISCTYIYLIFVQKKIKKKTIKYRTERAAIPFRPGKSHRSDNWLRSGQKKSSKKSKKRVEKPNVENFLSKNVIKVRHLGIWVITPFFQTPPYQDRHCIAIHIRSRPKKKYFFYIELSKNLLSSLTKWKIVIIHRIFKVGGSNLELPKKIILKLKNKIKFFSVKIFFLALSDLDIAASG